MTGEIRPYRLALISTSRASDAGHLAAFDLASIADELGIEYRLVGGNAVSVLTAVHQVTDLVPDRETADADFGAEPVVIANPDLLARLVAHGYEQEGGNRFRRTVETDERELALVIDVLAPSYHGRLRTNQQYGELYVDEIPGLALAIARPATEVNVEVRLTSGRTIKYHTPLPDVVSALCMKAHSYVGRLAERDAVDIWRLLEVALAAGVTAQTWPRGASATQAARTLHRHFGVGGAGPAHATQDRAKQTRIRALVTRVVARPIDR